MWRRPRARANPDDRPDASSAAADEAIEIAAAQRAPAAFAPLYDRYYPRILGYCYRRVGTIEQAEDLAQQVFVRALRTLPSYRPVAGASFRAWLFTIAHNAVIDHRRRARDISSYDDDVSLQPVDRAPLPAEEAVRRERLRDLRAAIATLSPTQRAVVELRLAGLKGREIAESLDMTHGAVKSAQLRAFATLRNRLESLEHDDAI